MHDTTSITTRPDNTFLAASSQPILPGGWGAWRGPGWEGWQAPLFDALDVELERTRAELDAGDIDTLADNPPPPSANQCVLDLAVRARPGQRGGRTVRPPPPVEWLVGCVRDGVTKNHRELEGKTSFPNADVETCAEWMHYVYSHRGRAGGLSSTDYAWQREWTIVRALDHGFFTSRRALLQHAVLDISDALAAELLGDEETPYRRRWLAIVITAWRLHKTGVTMSGPEIASLLGPRCSTSTAWAVIAWGESRGFNIRARRYKPGRNGIPVGLGKGWHGIAPGLLEYQHLFEGAQRELELTVEQTDATSSAIRRVRKHRRRHRRMRRRTLARARGESITEPGRAMPGRVEFARAVLQGIELRDGLKFRLHAAVASVDGEIRRQAAELAAGVALPDFEAVRVLRSTAVDVHAQVFAIVAREVLEAPTPPGLEETARAAVSAELDDVDVSPPGPSRASPSLSRTGGGGPPRPVDPICNPIRLQDGVPILVREKAKTRSRVDPASGPPPPVRESDGEARDGPGGETSTSSSSADPAALAGHRGNERASPANSWGATSTTPQNRPPQPATNAEPCSGPKGDARPVPPDRGARADATAELERMLDATSAATRQAITERVVPSRRTSRSCPSSPVDDGPVSSGSPTGEATHSPTSESPPTTRRGKAVNRCAACRGTGGSPRCPRCGAPPRW